MFGSERRIQSKRAAHSNKDCRKNWTSTLAISNITGKAFAERNVVENNWDCSSNGHTIPQQESVLPAPLCKHTSYPTIHMATTRSYSRTLRGQERQVSTQLQPQNRNGNPGTPTCLGSQGSLFLK